ncbi:hypothetical protein BJY04DRAFT_187295 [Aspergillus karnatakaensis]|uniref:GNAT family N-acetyltransferase n=1 Tax=Aspergillus karnatakaensis TaxID=1810916 RepID=UPI003CCCF486
MNLFLFLIVLLLHPPFTSSTDTQTPLSKPDQRTLRNATIADAKDIAETVAAAFASTPHFQYIYQFRNEFPTEHLKCLEEVTVSAVQHHQSEYRLQVIDNPSAYETGKSGNAVGVAVWELQDDEDEDDDVLSVGSMLARCAHRDLNVTRTVDFNLKLIALKKRHLDSSFGSRQLYLNTLATHPEYQGLGIGTDLVTAGLEAARASAVNVTLLATQAGRGVYRRLGFQSVANVSVVSVDEDQVFEFEAMAWST